MERKFILQLNGLILFQHWYILIANYLQLVVFVYTFRSCIS